MVCRGGEYVIVEDNKAFLSRRMPVPLCYSRCNKPSKSLIFIAEDGTVVIAALGSNGLVYDERVND